MADTGVSLDELTLDLSGLDGNVTQKNLGDDESLPFGENQNHIVSEESLELDLSGLKESEESNTFPETSIVNDANETLELNLSGLNGNVPHEEAGEESLPVAEDYGVADESIELDLSDLNGIVTQGQNIFKEESLSATETQNVADLSLSTKEFTNLADMKDPELEDPIASNADNEDLDCIQVGLSPDPRQQEDFEDNIHDLSLIPSARDDNSGDSDSSEFEVPDRPAGESTKGPVVPDPGGDVTQKKPSQAYGIDLNAVKGENMEPDILTPRNKVTSDLPLGIKSTKVTLDQSSDAMLQNNSALSNEPLSGFSKTDKPDLTVQDSSKPVTSFRKAFVQESQEGSHSSPQETAEPSGQAISPSLEDRPDEPKPSIVTTAEDWEGVQTVEPVFAGEGKASAVTVENAKPLVTFSESWTQFESFDYSSVQDQVVTQIDRKGFSAFTHFLFGPPKLHKDLHSQRSLLYCVAATAMDNEIPIHLRVLHTIYRSLTGAKFDCQRFGGHWEEIGFQGRDPATDLRGTGMLALLHLLSFLREPKTKELARDVYKLSLHPTQNFPFCVMGINLSRLCLQVFREGVYNKECNRRKDVVSTMNDVYGALFLQLLKVWKKGKTIADSGFVLQDVESYGRKHSKSVFNDLEEYAKSHKQQELFVDSQEGTPAFFSVCKEDKCDDKTAAELY